MPTYGLENLSLSSSPSKRYAENLLKNVAGMKSLCDIDLVAGVDGQRFVYKSAASILYH